MTELCFGCMANDISKQCESLGIESTGMPMPMVDRVNSAINLLYVRGIATGGDCDKMRKRLIKDAKFKAGIAPKGSPAGSEGKV